MYTWQLLNNGLDLASIALFLNRFTLGLFYVLARFRFFYDPSKSASFEWSIGEQRWLNSRWFNAERHKSLSNKMQHCGFERYPRTLAWIAALIEVGGGLMLILGFFSTFAALGLFILTLFATRCTWRTKVYEQSPVDCLDACSCYLWRVEGLYLVMCLVTILAGPGAMSLT